MAINTELSKGEAVTNIDGDKIKKYFNNEEIKQQALVEDKLPNKFSVYIKNDGEIFIFTGNRQVYPSLKDSISKPEGKGEAIKTFENIL